MTDQQLDTRLVSGVGSEATSPDKLPLKRAGTKGVNVIIIDSDKEEDKNEDLFNMKNMIDSKKDKSKVPAPKEEDKSALQYVSKISE